MIAPPQGTGLVNSKATAMALDLMPNLVRDLGASGSSKTVSATGTAGSTTLTVDSVGDFHVGQAIWIAGGGGSAPSVGKPSSLAVTPSVTGTTTYTYYVASVDGTNGGIGVPVSVSTTTGPASNPQNKVTWDAPSSGTGAGYLIWGATTNPAGSQGYLGCGYGETFWDYGTTTASLANAYVPNTPLTDAQPGPFSATISAIQGITWTLNTALTSAVSDATVFHDDTAALGTTAQDTVYTSNAGAVHYIQAGQVFQASFWYPPKSLLLSDVLAGPYYDSAPTFRALPGTLWQLLDDNSTTGYLTECSVTGFQFDGYGPANPSTLESVGAALATACALDSCTFYNWTIDAVFGSNATRCNFLDTAAVATETADYPNWAPSGACITVANSGRDTGILTIRATRNQGYFTANPPVQMIHVTNATDVIAETAENVFYSSVYNSLGGSDTAGFGVYFNGVQGARSMGDVMATQHYALFIDNGTVETQDVVVEGGYFWAQAGNSALEARQGQRITLRGCIFKGSAGSAIGVNYSGPLTRMDIQGCQFVDGTVSITSNEVTSTKHHISQCEFVTENISSSNTGLTITGVSDGFVESCLIADKDGGMVLQGVTDWDLVNNTVYDNVGVAVLLEDNGSTGCTGVRVRGGIIGNTSTTNTTYGVKETGATNSTSVEHVRFNSIATKAIDLIGSTSYAQQNPGYNPTGALTGTTVPDSGTAMKNPAFGPARVFITGGTVTAIAINGHTTGLTTGALILEPSDTLTLTYSVAPTVVWEGI